MKTIIATELDQFARGIKNRGKHLCLVYSGDFRKIEDIYRQISNHLLSVVSIYELESTDREVCEYCAIEELRVAGYEIHHLEVVYPEWYAHARINPNGIFHIAHNGEHLLCGKEFQVLHELQEYFEQMEHIHKICKKCEKLYQERVSGER